MWWYLSDQLFTYLSIHLFISFEAVLKNISRPYKLKLAMTALVGDPWVSAMR